MCKDTGKLSNLNHLLCHWHLFSIRAYSAARGSLGNEMLRPLEPAEMDTCPLSFCAAGSVPLCAVLASVPQFEIQCGSLVLKGYTKMM